MTDLEKKNLGFTDFVNTCFKTDLKKIDISLWDASFLNLKAKNSHMKKSEDASQPGIRHWITTLVISESNCYSSLIIYSFDHNLYFHFHKRFSDGL